MSGEHEHCHCERCAAKALPPGERERRLLELQLRELEWVGTFGFFTHFVAPRVGHPEDSPAQAHTHGLVESMNHPDLQIKFPLSGKTAQGVFHSVVDRIREGQRFEAGKDYDGILTNDYKVRMIEAIEDGRTVLRIILPPKSGALDQDKMEEEIYKAQYEGLDG